jgi:hypothetical protein
VRRLSLLVAATALLTTACRPDTVRIAFHPRPDAHYRYAVDVTAETETRLAGRQPTRNRTDDHLEADHAVLAVDAGLATVQVRLHSGTGPDRSFEVRFDRAAALTEVRRVEDLPASALGELGLAEVFPAAAGAPPDRPLRPGSAWTIDEPVTLPPSLPSRLTGSGRLVDLGVVSSRKVATVHSSYSLPVHQTLNTPQGEVVLDGTETTSVSATHDLADGAIEVFRARTTGRFDLSVVPPPGTSGTSIGGQLDVEVRSSTRRTA